MPQFSGTTIECLKEYAKRFRVKSDAAQKIAHVTHTSLKTVLNWFYIEKPNPHGEPFIRLGYFLESEGFDVDELKDLRTLKPRAYEMGKMLYEDKITIENIQEQLGYAERKLTYGFLRGRWGLGEERMKAVETLLSHKAYSVPQITQSVVKKDTYANTQPPVSHKLNGIKQPELFMKTGQRLGLNKLAGKILFFAAAMEFFMPLLEDFVMRENRQSRVELRAAMGENFDKLQRLIRAMASEEARTAITSEAGFKRFYKEEKKEEVYAE